METESSTAQTWHRRQYNLFPEKDRGSTSERRKNMKLNIKKFMMTEMGGEPEDHLEEYFERFSKYYKRKNESGKVVYVLTNFNSTIKEDLYRIYTLRSLKFDPYIMIYDKEKADETHKRMARWVNNRIIWRSCERYEDYK